MTKNGTYIIKYINADDNETLKNKVQMVEQKLNSIQTVAARALCMTLKRR